MSDPPARRPLVEMDLLQPLMEWLRSRRQVRDDSILVEEFPWLGRRVDLALLTRSGTASAFELKVAHNRRAIEQSYLNAVAFDRSYLVTATRPSPTNLVQAQAIGLGVVFISLTRGGVSLLLAPRQAEVHLQVRARLRRALQQRGSTASV
jgi:hypothetical protein